MICWWCSEVFAGGDDKTPTCKQDGHILNKNKYIAAVPDPKCPINKKKGGVKYGNQENHGKAKEDLSDNA